MPGIFYHQIKTTQRRMPEHPAQGVTAAVLEHPLPAAVVNFPSRGEVLRCPRCVRQPAGNCGSDANWQRVLTGTLSPRSATPIMCAAHSVRIAAETKNTLRGWGQIHVHTSLVLGFCVCFSYGCCCTRLLFQHVTHLQWICACAVWNANAAHISHAHACTYARVRVCG